MVHACNPRIWEAEERLPVQCQPGPHGDFWVSQGCMVRPYYFYIHFSHFKHVLFVICQPSLQHSLKRGLRAQQKLDQIKAVPRAKRTRITEPECEKVVRTSCNRKDTEPCLEGRVGSCCREERLRLCGHTCGSRAGHFRRQPHLTGRIKGEVTITPYYYILYCIIIYSMYYIITYDSLVYCCVWYYVIVLSLLLFFLLLFLLLLFFYHLLLENTASDGLA